jgi:hypothetical protein
MVHMVNFHKTHKCWTALCAEIQWHSVTNWKYMGLILDGVTGIFHWYNTSGCSMALESTQPLTEMSTRNIYGEEKAASAYGWQPYHLPVLTVVKSGSPNLLKPSGPIQACTGIALPFTDRNSCSGPYLRTGQRGPGPGQQISRGGILKKNRDWSVVCGEKKGCPRERNLREIYTENTIMFCLLSVFCGVFAYT